LDGPGVITMRGDDGYDFVPTVRAREAGRGGPIPALALTAYVGIEDRADAIAAVGPLRHHENDEVRQRRLHPGITPGVAPNQSQSGPKSTTSEGLIHEALFVLDWLQSRFEKGS